MFSQELLTNGELNHFSLKERMVEIGRRWHKLSQVQKDKYKKMVEEQQIEYKVELDSWIKVGCISGEGQGAGMGTVCSAAGRAGGLPCLQLALRVSQKTSKT